MGGCGAGHTEHSCSCTSKKGFAEGIDHDIPNRSEFNKLVIRILELERRVKELEENKNLDQLCRRDGLYG